MDINEEVAKKTYEVFNDWSSKKESNLEYIGKNYDATGMSTIYDDAYKRDLDSDEKQKRNKAILEDLQRRRSEKELGDSFDLTKTLEDIADNSDEETKKEIEEGLKNIENYEYYNLGVGEVLTKDKNGDGRLSFEEFLEAEKAECPDAEYDEVLEEKIKIVFDSIASYNNKVENDNDPNGQYISMSEMTSYYYAYDKIDEELHCYESSGFDITMLQKISKDKPDGDKKLYKGNSFDYLFLETPAIAIDSWMSDEENNNDCPSRLVYNLYGVDYYSEKGQEIWNKIKELNPGLDENTFFADMEIELP